MKKKGIFKQFTHFTVNEIKILCLTCAFLLIEYIENPRNIHITCFNIYS